MLEAMIELAFRAARAFAIGVFVMLAGLALLVLMVFDDNAWEFYYD